MSNSMDRMGTMQPLEYPGHQEPASKGLRDFQLMMRGLEHCPDPRMAATSIGAPGAGASVVKAPG